LDISGNEFEQELKINDFKSINKLEKLLVRANDLTDFSFLKVLKNLNVNSLFFSQF
jgi:hypothetical protein